MHRHIARRRRREAEDDGAGDVERRLEGMSGAQQGQRLQRERGDRRVAAEDADGEPGPEQPVAGGLGVGREEGRRENADAGRAADVDDQSAPGKGHAPALRDEPGDPVAPDAADAAADGDQQDVEEPGAHPTPCDRWSRATRSAPGVAAGHWIAAIPKWAIAGS
jgi:hypothetical protein